MSVTCTLPNSGHKGAVLREVGFQVSEQGAKSRCRDRGSPPDSPICSCMLLQCLRDKIQQSQPMVLPTSPGEINWDFLTSAPPNSHRPFLRTHSCLSQLSLRLNFVPGHPAQAIDARAPFSAKAFPSYPAKKLPFSGAALQWDLHILSDLLSIPLLRGYRALLSEEADTYRVFSCGFWSTSQDQTLYLMSLMTVFWLTKWIPFTLSLLKPHLRRHDHGRNSWVEAKGPSCKVQSTDTMHGDSSTTEPKCLQGIAAVHRVCTALASAASTGEKSA